MWPEALPSFGIIAAAITFAGAGLHFINRWERGGKVCRRVPKFARCKFYKRASWYIHVRVYGCRIKDGHWTAGIRE